MIFFKTLNITQFFNLIFPALFSLHPPAKVKAVQHFTCVCVYMFMLV